MLRKVKKTISILLVIILSLTAVPLQELLGLGLPISMQAGAAYEDGAHYQPMPSQYAKAFIGFIYDKSEVTEEMMAAGDIYNFLTGGYEQGTLDELIAKIIFLEITSVNLSQCTSKYTLMTNNAYDVLLDYLYDQLPGSVDGGIVDQTLDKITTSVAQTIITIASETGDAVWEDVEFIMSTYKSISSLPGKIESVQKDVKALVNTFAYAWGNSRVNMYKYLYAYIENKSCEDLLSDLDAEGLLADINNFNHYELAASGLFYDPILNWASDDNIAVLEYFGDFIYDVSESLEYQLGQLQNSAKKIDVHCPTDVYLYNDSHELLLQVVDNQVTKYADNVYALVLDSQKTLVVSADLDFHVRVVGTGTGEMHYAVTEYLDRSIMRTVEYPAVPVEEGTELTASVPKNIYIAADSYNLTSDTGETIAYDYDSLPPVEDDIVDVVVAEELFDGFPREVIDRVATTMFAMQSTVDLTDYDIAAEDAVALFSAVAKYYPSEYSLITAGDFSYRIVVSPNLDRIMSIRFYYGSDVKLSDYQRRVKELNAEIDALVAKTEGMTDFEKVLYLHDYIVLHSEYDLELLAYMEENNGMLSGEMYSEKYTEYSILVNGTGVCGSYALAYRAVLNAVGVECLYLSSREMNHAWNLVQLDGKWYHVDCCWDDPVPDTYGTARRTYFLCTEAEIMELRHTSWAPGRYKANSETYSAMPRYANPYQKYDDGTWYYLSGSRLYTADTYGQNETELGTLIASAIDAENGAVYYASGRAIYEYDIETCESRPVYLLPTADCGTNPASAYFYNIDITGDTVEYHKSIYNSENERVTILDTDTLEKEKYAAITGLSLSQSEAQLDVFQTLQLSAEILSEGATDGLEIAWSSSDPTVATVNEAGLVTGRNVGTATITASLFDFTVACTLTVTGNSLTGLCGDRVVWTFAPASGILSITGSGKMADYSSRSRTPWHAFRAEITSVEIADSVATIGDYAFYSCYVMATAEIGSSVTTIGDYAFYNCDALTTVEIGNSVITIGTCAFEYCDTLIAVKIGNSVTTIGNRAFSSCDALTEITVATENQNYSSDESGVLFNKSKTTLIQYPIGSSTTEYTNPDSVTTIADDAFYNCDTLDTVKIGKNVTTIGNYAFYDCDALTMVEIDSNVTTIGDYAFAYCDALTTSKIANSVTTIGASAFFHCGALTMIEIPDSVITIGASAFSDCGALVTVGIGDSVATIGNYAFSNCDVLTTVEIGSSVTTIGEYAFSNCEALTTIKIPDNVTTIGNGAFSDCDVLAVVEIGDGVTTIGNWAFESCVALTAIVIPDSVTTIGAWAFEYCAALTTIDISDSVTTINEGAFFGCDALTAITVAEENLNYYSDEYGVLFNKSKTTLIQYPIGNNRNEYSIPDSVATIGDYAFSNCDFLTKIKIHDSVTAIGYLAFAYCDALTTIDIPDSVTTIGDLVFRDCGSLTSITVAVQNPNYSSDEYGVLFNKEKTELIQYPIGNLRCSYIIPDSVTSIAAFAFSNCKTLFSVVIPENVLKIYYAAFTNCINLQKVLVQNTSCSISKVPFFGLFVWPENTILYGHADSTTQDYAEKFGNPFVNIDAEPHVHDYFLMDYVQKTETTDGYARYWCYCGESAYEEIDHNFGEPVISGPSCTTDGVSVKTCTVCGHSESEPAPATGHQYVLDSETDGDCLSNPTTTYRCENCGDTYTVAGAPEDKHNYVRQVIAPTCTEKGYTKEVCSRCGETVLSDFTSPLGHSFSIALSEGSCTAHGTWIYTCRRCGEVEHIAIDSSNLRTETVKTEPTCTESGKEDEVCTLCGATVSTKVLPALSHDYADEFTIDKAATCTEGGSMSKHCSRCDAKREVTEIPATGHEYRAQITAPTCTEEGFTTYTCSVCGDSYTADVTPATGHHCGRDGLCVDCGHDFTIGCTHLCHRNGILGFIWKIFCLFYRIFGLHPVCSCGMAHY